MLLLLQPLRRGHRAARKQTRVASTPRPRLGRAALETASTRCYAPREMRRVASRNAEGALAKCEAALAKCEAALAKCQAALAKCEVTLAKCEAALGKCEATLRSE